MKKISAIFAVLFCVYTVQVLTAENSVQLAGFEARNSCKPPEQGPPGSLTTAYGSFYTEITDFDLPPDPFISGSAYPLKQTTTASKMTLGNNDRVTVNLSGTYLVSYTITARLEGGNTEQHSAGVALNKIGSGIFPGSTFYTLNEVGAAVSVQQISGVITVHLNAGDQVNLVVAGNMPVSLAWVDDGSLQFASLVALNLTRIAD